MRLYGWWNVQNGENWGKIDKLNLIAITVLGRLTLNALTSD